MTKLEMIERLELLAATLKTETKLGREMDALDDRMIELARHESELNREYEALRAERDRVNQLMETELYRVECIVRKVDGRCAVPESVKAELENAEHIVSQFIEQH